MEIFAFVLLFVLFILSVLGLIISLATLVEFGFKKDQIILSVVTLGIIAMAIVCGHWSNGLAQDRVNEENAVRQAVCLQIPEAEWIADINTCIKNGEVVPV